MVHLGRGIDAAMSPRERMRAAAKPLLKSQREDRGMPADPTQDRVDRETALKDVEEATVRLAAARKNAQASVDVMQKCVDRLEEARAHARKIGALR